MSTRSINKPATELATVEIPLRLERHNNYDLNLLTGETVSLHNTK